MMVVSLAAVLILAAYGYVMTRPAVYYRYQHGGVRLVNSPHAVWNGLRGGPCIQFKIPALRRPESWQPTVDEIRTYLKEHNEYVDEAETLRIAAVCVPVGD